ncbi:hypothetical protein [Methylobacterium sp. 285MFTsu5.1]|uniref:phage major capsid protein n=1 Tax=Methylobacterium sp. 285MFTsu5.1 TaxID=1172187 RepID=UPI00037D4D55|nr:hypothetical protein [Methylobacterium sp. 285MFTsu5.1]
MSVAQSGAPYGGPNPTTPYVGTFIPEIWSGKLIEKFYASTVLAAISNTDYEGEIKNQGDKVIIRTKPTITIRDYQVNQSLQFERPSAPTTELTIDKAKYFATIVDDVIETQSDINQMSLWSEDAGEQMKITIDTDVLGGMLGAANAKNSGVAAGKISGMVNLGATGTPLHIVPRDADAGQVEIVDLLVRLGQVLDEQNIPETGRWVVMPTWIATQIKQSELRNAALSGDSVSMLRNGRLGQIDRFTLYSSNLLPSHATNGAALAAGEWPIYAGHAHGLTFASQVSKVETLRSESTFGTIMRGLQVYGYKVLDDIALAQAVVAS